MAIKIKDYGDFGTGAQGDVTITQNTQVNSYAQVNGVSGDGKTIEITVRNCGVYGNNFKAGQTVMFHVVM